MNVDENMNFDEEKAETDLNISHENEYKERKQITSAEEFLKLPKERRDKALADMKYFFDNSETIIPQAAKEACREQLERGTPISYGDDQGRVLRRYPNRKIFTVKINRKTYEVTETFLRMATPEDDIGLYD